MAEYGMKPMLNFTNLPAPVEMRKKRRRRAVKTPTNPRVKAVTLSQACRSQGEAGGVTSTAELSLKWVSPQFENVPHTQSVVLNSAVPVGRKQVKVVPLEVRGGARLHVSRGKARKRGRKVRPRRMPLHELDGNSLEDFESPKAFKSTCISKPSKKLVSGTSSNLDCQEEKHSEVPYSAVRNSVTASTQTDGGGDGHTVGNQHDSDRLSPPKTLHSPCQTRLQRSGSSADISRMLSDMSLEETPNPSHHLPGANTLTGSPQRKLDTPDSRGLRLTRFDITAFSPHAASTPAALRQLRPRFNDAAEGSHDTSCVQPWELDAAASFKTPVRYSDGWRMGAEPMVIPNTRTMRSRPSGTRRNHCTLPTDTPSPSTTPSDCEAPPDDCTLGFPPSSRTTPGLSSPSTFDCRHLFVSKEHSVLASETPRHLWGVPLNKWGYRLEGIRAPSVEDTFS